MTSKEFAEKYVGCIMRDKGGTTITGEVVGYDPNDEGGLSIMLALLENSIEGHSKRDVVGEYIVVWLKEVSDDTKCYWVEADEKLLLTKPKKNKYTPKKEPLPYDQNIIEEYKNRFKDIDKIIINGTCTILYLKNGTKAVVHLGEGDDYDLEIGIREAHIKALRHSTYKLNYNIIHTHPYFDLN